MKEEARNVNWEVKSQKLHELFMNEEVKSVKRRKFVEDRGSYCYKELSPDMVMFMTHLYKEGCFKDSNLLRRNKFDIVCFENSYARVFFKYAVEQFGRDHQEIAHGTNKFPHVVCTAFACSECFSSFSVCSKCVLKASLKFGNQNVWKGNTTNLHMAVVMRVITLYALESVPSLLVISDEMKAWGSQLLMNILRCSQTVS